MEYGRSFRVKWVVVVVVGGGVGVVVVFSTQYFAESGRFSIVLVYLQLRVPPAYRCKGLNSINIKMESDRFSSVVFIYN